MFVTLFGGLAFFLYGMKLLSDSLKKTAGGRLEKLLNKATDNQFKGLTIGAIITIAIQSSSAMTVMLVGFEPHPVEADQSAFGTDPYIIGPVLVDPVHLRVGEAGFRQIQAGVLTRRRQKCAPEEHGRKQKTSHCHFWFICYKNTNSFCPASAMVQKRQLLLHRTVSNDCKDDTFAKTQEDQPNNQL